MVPPAMPGARVLIVDDEPVNREVLKAQLNIAGYRTEEATNGVEALGILLDPERKPVDIVLLDVMMPKLSGFEVCRSLRQKLSPEDLPILFLTAKVQGEDVVTGLSAGGNDYLTKPFSREELLARIQVHLGLLHAHRTLKQQHEELDTVHKQLVQQEKMAQLGLLSAGVAHEINNPNNFLSISAQTVEQRLQELKSFIDSLLEDEADPELRESFQSRFSALFSQLSLVKDGSSRIATIVKSMRAASRNDSGEMRPFDPAEGLLATVQLVSSTWKQKVRFDTQAVTARAHVMGHASQLNQVFTNLMVNACHAIEEKQTASGDTTPGVVSLSTQIDGEFIVIGIEDSGCGMPEHVRKRLFEPFFTTKGAERGTGLGMGICRAIIDEHRGRIDVDSTAGVGTTFRVFLPVTESLPQSTS